MPTFEVSISDELKVIKQDIHEIRQELTKYKGFIGGLIWTLAALLTAVNLFIEWVKN